MSRAVLPPTDSQISYAHTLVRVKILTGWRAGVTTEAEAHSYINEIKTRDKMFRAIRALRRQPSREAMKKGAEKFVARYDPGDGWEEMDESMREVIRRVAVPTHERSAPEPNRCGT